MNEVDSERDHAMPAKETRGGGRRRWEEEQLVVGPFDVNRMVGGI